MSDDIAIKVENLGKCYQIYDKPSDRLKQFIFPKLQRLFGIEPKKYYREFWAIKDVSFQVNKGETVGIIGLNGSGKSTLLKMICGTLNPTDGNIEVNGRIAALLELGSGFNPEFTGRENVYLNAAILGLSEKEVEARFDDIASFADIGDFIDQPVKTYSSGMLVRLAFSVSVFADPNILVVDEALAVGDEAFQRKCFLHIEKLRSKGCTILFCTHSLQLIVQLCDEAILIYKGNLVLRDLPKFVTSAYFRLSNIQSTTESNTAILTDDFEGLSSSEKFNSTTNEFDPTLTSKSCYVSDAKGASICNLCLANLAEDKVNLLFLGQSYHVKYDVDFHLQVTGVSFEFLIKSVNGTVIAGMDTSKTKAYYPNNIVEAGHAAQINFEFVCNFLPGPYFLSVTVRGLVDEEYEVLHKMQEVIMLRVLEQDNCAQFGIVNLNVKPSIKIT